MVGLKKRHMGFTLVEVLLAVAVLAIVVGPLLSLFLQGFLTTQSAGMKTMAVSYSREGMESLKAQGVDWLAEKAEGQHPLFTVWYNSVGEDYHCFYEVRWVAREVEIASSTASVELLEITVYVKYFDRVERDVVLTSYLTGR